MSKFFATTVSLKNMKIESSWRGKLLRKQTTLFLEKQHENTKENLENNCISLFIDVIFVPTKFVSLKGLTNHFNISNS